MREAPIGRVLSGRPSVTRMLQTGRDAGTLTTYTYDVSGNLSQSYTTDLSGVAVPVITSMIYDKENRMVSNGNYTELPPILTSFTYSGDGLKRAEVAYPGTRTTLVWDGLDYLQGRS